jgi:hypothetical protein
MKTLELEDSFPFGKFKGVSVGEVAKSPKALKYFTWWNSNILTHEVSITALAVAEDSILQHSPNAL